MLRTIGGVAGGCIAIVIVVAALFSLANSILGPERAISPSWIMLSIVVMLLAAIIGGLVAASIGKETKAPLILAGLVLIIGAVLALHDEMRNPAWIALVNPVIGFTGVLAGARLRKS